MGSEARRRGLAILAAAVLGAAGGPFSARPGAALAETTLRSPATISAVDVLARVTAADQPLASYAVPVHIEARLHRLFTFHFGLDGMVYYKRPDRLALDMHHVPSDFRRLFGELGTPLTWSSTYDMNVVSASVAGGRTTYHLKGVPRRDGPVATMLLDVDDVAGAPLHAQWVCRDGSRIDETITEGYEGVYELPRHADADIMSGGMTIHATMDYGTYDVNQSLADSLFANV
ncbi:MAG TPA: hypothetical protein VFB22_05130 [Candidatus Baltobacteraceae bacterium]|nr:hypothetical protein [Candidatus Baltobacteraceae bacterium]